jgi:hypothetical protein
MHSAGASYELRLDAMPKPPDANGATVLGWDFHGRVTTFDGLLVAEFNAPSPAALGRLVGESIRALAEAYEQHVPVPIAIPGAAT